MNTKNFIIENKPVKKTKNEAIMSKTLRIKRKQNELSTYADIKTIYDSIIESKKFEAGHISIGVMTDSGYLTIKSFGEEDLKQWDDEDYYRDKALSERFNEYQFFDIYIMK